MRTNVVTAEDLSLLGELYETIERKPPAIEARKLLIQQLLAFGWDDAAHDAAKELLCLRPVDSEAKALLARSCKGILTAPKSAANGADGQKGELPVRTRQPRAIPAIKLSEDVKSSQQDLRAGYKELQKCAKALEKEVRLLRDLCEKKGLNPPFIHHALVLSAISDGQITSVLRPQL